MDESFPCDDYSSNDTEDSQYSLFQRVKKLHGNRCLLCPTSDVLFVESILETDGPANLLV